MGVVTAIGINQLFGFLRRYGFACLDAYRMAHFIFARAVNAGEAVRD